jgi:peptidoglycan/LPS O-acetylase OafA/YrhL
LRNFPQLPESCGPWVGGRAKIGVLMRVRSARRAAPVSPGDRLDFIEGLRGVAALYVVLGHFCSMADPRAFLGQTSFAPLWLQRLMAPFWYGHLAVAAFIVLSGFCLQMSLFNGQDGRIRNYKRFFKRRALRILPPYYACLALSMFVALTVTVTQPGVPFNQYLPLNHENVAAHWLLVHNLQPQWMYKINGVLWSIAAEAQLYLVFPLLVLVLAKMGRIALLLLSTAAAVAVLIYVPGGLKLYPWYLALFALGMLSAHFAFRPRAARGPRPVGGMAVAALGFGGVVAGTALGWMMPVVDGLVGIGLAGLMYAGAVAPMARVPWAFAWRPLVGLGAFSYSLYLMHHPIQQILHVYRPAAVQGEALGFGYLMLVGLPAILLGSWLFGKLFEQPFIGSKRKPVVFRLGGAMPLALPLRGAPLGSTCSSASTEAAPFGQPDRVEALV